MWKTIKLDDIAKPVGGSGFPKKYQGKKEGEIPFFKVSDMNLPENDKYMYSANNFVSRETLKEMKAKTFPAGTIIFPKIGGAISTNKKRILTRTSAFDNNVMGLIPSEKISSEYLYMLFLSLDLYEISNKAALPSITVTAVKEITILLPPLAEQERIVAKLDAAFAEIDGAVSVVEAKETEVQKLKASLLSRVIDDQNSNLTPLGEVIKIARGGSPRPIKSYLTNDDNGVNWIKIGDTEQGGRYIYSTKEKIKPSGTSRSRFVKEDDFLLSNSMSFGRPYILRTSGCIHDGWLVLSEYQKFFSSDYLYYLLSSSYVQNQFEILAKGSTVRNLNIDLVSKVLVPIPSLTDQKKISEKLDRIFKKFDEYHHAILKNQRNYKLLKSSILLKELQSSEAA